jgi:quinol monooxygenase YgiN
METHAAGPHGRQGVAGPAVAGSRARRGEQEGAMAQIFVVMTYDVKPRKREEFLSWIRKVRRHIRRKYGPSYTIAEDRDVPNRFTEIFVCANRAAYEKLETLHDARLDQYMWEMDDFVGNREEAVFHTLVEI